MSKCPYCQVEIQSGDEFVICPKDNALHHTQCWEANGNRCSVFECMGSGDIPTQKIGEARVKANQISSFSTFSALPKISLPTNVRQWVVYTLGAIIGMITWAGLGLLLVEFIFPLLPYTIDKSIPVLVAGLIGLWRGVHTPFKEIPRGGFVVAGWFTFHVIGVLINNLALIENEVQIFLSTYLPFISIVELLGVIGALAGGFLLEIRPNLLRSALGALLGYLVLNFFDRIWVDQIGDNSNLILIARLAILASFVFIPLLWKIPILPFLGSLISLLCGFGMFLISNEISLDAKNSYFLIAILITTLVGGAILVTRNGFQRDNNHITLKDLYQTSLLGILGFGIVSFGISITILFGNIMEPILNILLLKTVNSELFQLVFIKLSNQPVSTPYQFFIQHWQIFLVSYSIFYALDLAGGTSFIKAIHRVIRFIGLLFTCVIFAYVAEQTFEFVLNTWIIYTWFAKYITWSGGWLAISAVVISLLFVVSSFQDEIPLWAIAANFALWFVQILLLAAFAILVLGLLGIGLSELYANLVPNSYERIFGSLTIKESFVLIGVYAGLLIGAGYLLIKGVKKDLGWLATKFRLISLNISRKITIEIQQYTLLHRKWWQVLLMYIFSVSLLYSIISLR